MVAHSSTNAAPVSDQWIGDIQYSLDTTKDNVLYGELNADCCDVRTRTQHKSHPKEASASAYEIATKNSPMDKEAFWALIAGIILLVCGLLLFFYFR